MTFLTLFGAGLYLVATMATVPAKCQKEACIACKIEHFKALLKNDHPSSIADRVKNTGHNINLDHFDILASGKTDCYCKVKETLFVQDLWPTLNANVSSEKLLLY